MQLGRSDQVGLIKRHRTGPVVCGATVCRPSLKSAEVAASILATAYHLLADGTCYLDLGCDQFGHRDPARAASKLADRIRSLGYEVDILPAA